MGKQRWNNLVRAIRNTFVMLAHFPPPGRRLFVASGRLCVFAVFIVCVAGPAVGRAFWADDLALRFAAGLWQFSTHSDVSTVGGGSVREPHLTSRQSAATGPAAPACP